MDSSGPKGTDASGNPILQARRGRARVVCGCGREVACMFMALRHLAAAVR